MLLEEYVVILALGSLVLSMLFTAAVLLWGIIQMLE